MGTIFTGERAKVYFPRIRFTVVIVVVVSAAAAFICHYFTNFAALFRKSM